MPKMTYVVANWSRFRRTLEGTPTSKYHEITTTVKGETYAIIQASRPSTQYDKKKLTIPIPITMVERQPALILHLIRDTGIGFTITILKRAAFLFEPGEDWTAHFEARLGTDLEAIRSAMLRGPVGDLIGGDPRLIRATYRQKVGAVRAENSKLLEKVTTADRTAATATSHARNLLHELGSVTRRKDELEHTLLERRAVAALSIQA